MVSNASAGPKGRRRPEGEAHSALKSSEPMLMRRRLGPVTGQAITIATWHWRQESQTLVMRCSVSRYIYSRYQMVSRPCSLTHTAPSQPTDLKLAFRSSPFRLKPPHSHPNQNGEMSYRGSSRSSSVYSQDSGRGGGRAISTSVGAPVRTSSPEPMDPSYRAPSSRYSGATSAGSGNGNPPARSLPSSGYSPARPSSRASSGSGGPATPAHASLMSAYGHSSYAGSQAPPSYRSSSGSGGISQAPLPSGSSYSKTFIDSAPQTSPARGPPLSGTSYSQTFMDSAVQTSAARGPASSASLASRPTQSQPPRGSSDLPPAFSGSFMANVSPTDMNLVNSAGRSSRGRRPQGRND